MVTLAAEVLPTQCRMAAVRLLKSGVAEVQATSTWSASDPDLIDKLRAFRRRYGLPQDVRLAVWPKPHNRGVLKPLVQTWSEQAPPTLSPLRLRDAAAPFVRAGYSVADAIPAHEGIKAAAKRLDVTAALVLALNAECGAIVAPSGAVAYMAWDVDSLQPDGPKELLVRYQFAAAVSPKLRALFAERADAVVAYGGLPRLRSFVMPLVEELDQDVMVIDQPEPGVIWPREIAADQDAISSLQVVLAAGLRLDAPDDGVHIPFRFC